MKIKTVKIEEAIPYVRNPRQNKAAIAKVSASLKEFGWQQPIVVDKDMVVIAGHTRLEAARTLGMDKVPVQIAEDLTDAQVKAYRIADNRVSQEAEWDLDLLRLELSDLDNLDYDLLLTGFDDDELNGMLTEAVEGFTDEDDVPELPDEPVSVLGDIWTLGNHRLMCGDSTSVDAVDKLMDGNKADMVFTDPPYGISVVGGAKARNGTIGGAKARNGTICGANKVQAAEYKAVIGDDDEYNPSHIFLSFPDAKYILWGANYYNDKLPIGGRWFVWDKNRGEGTSFSDCELAWSNIKGIVVKKYKVTWDGMNREGESGKRVHPTQKPVLLSEKILLEFNNEKNIVDLFGGSGSTLLACQKTGRNCRMMELDEVYVDVIIKRWQDFTGKEAVHAETGKTFNEMKAERDGGK